MGKGVKRTLYSREMRKILGLPTGDEEKVKENCPNKKTELTQVDQARFRFSRGVGPSRQLAATSCQGDFSVC